MNLNKVYLIGRLTADPESRTTQTGQTVTSLRMATNRVWTDPSGNKNEATEFHSITAWARLGEIASQYLKRGALLMVEGRLQTRSWDAQDGSKRYRTEIVAENIQMGPRSSNDNGGFQQQNNKPQQNNAAPAQEEEIPVINEDEAGINPDDIPF